MKTVTAIAKREGVNPEEGKKKYGDVQYADEKNKKYPLDKDHIRAALSYWGMPKNRAKYSAADQKTIGARIRAAAKKHGIDTSDDDDDDKDNGDDGGDKSESSRDMFVIAGEGAALNGETPTEIVYLPKGEHRITPAVNGKPKTINVTIDSSVTKVLQQALERRLSDPVRPYSGFNHVPGPASFLPKAFKWDDTKGVVLEVDWTDGGKKAVAGRDYSYFSPTFLLDNKGKIAGLTKEGEIGSLTNNPAFKTIDRIAASSDGKPQRRYKDDISMSAIADKLVELEVITAEQAENADEAFLIRAIDGMHGALGIVETQLRTVTAENLNLQAKVKEVQKAEATQIIQAAVAAGKIPGKDENIVSFYTEQYIMNPTLTKKVLAALPDNPALQKMVTVDGVDSKRVVTGATSHEMIEKQKRKVKEIRAANPNLDHDSAFNKAREENPDLFPVEA